MKTLEFFRIQEVSPIKQARLIELMLPLDILQLYKTPTKQYVEMLKRLHNVDKNRYAWFNWLGTQVVKLLTFVLKQEPDWIDYIIPFRVAKDIEFLHLMNTKLAQYHARIEIKLLNEKKANNELWYNVRD